MSSAIDRQTATHYTWGEVCDGWRLLAGADLSVIEERVPPGAGEIRHHHVHARQFFYVLSGVATLEFDDGPATVGAGQGIHVPPGVRHRFANHSDADVRFLVISSPSTAGDRVEQPESGAPR